MESESQEIEATSEGAQFHRQKRSGFADANRKVFLNRAIEVHTGQFDLAGGSQGAVNAGQDVNICEGDNIVLSAAGADTYSWTTSADTLTVLSNDSLFTVSPSATTTYLVTGANGGSCEDEDDITVTVTPLPVADFSISAGPNKTNLPAAFLNSSTGATGYSWDFGDGTFSNTTNPSHSYSSSGSYTVTLIALNGSCADTFLLTISVIQDETDVYVPDAFTPNGDGLNDSFVLAGQGVDKIELMIFNRWGEEIYKATGASKTMQSGWNGTRNGRQQSVGVYAYYLTGSFNDGRTFEKQGSITLLR